MIRYIIRKLDEFFYGRYIDRVMEEVMREYMENPKFLINEDDEKWWVGYKK